MRKIHMVGNWKMNQTKGQIDQFFQDFNGPKESTGHCAWIAPQALHLHYMIERYGDKLSYGAQNCSEQDFGAFTGENATESIKDMGAIFTLVGHSERRSLYGEDNQLLNKKVHQAIKSGLQVIYCVGETLEERESGQMEEVLRQQIIEGLKDISESLSSSLIIAYEPVWAIGTGKTATPDQAQEAHAFIRDLISTQLGLPGEKTPILYGGSVKPANATELLGQKDIDGGLVGGASLKGDSFAQLCQIAKEVGN
jgi:triosephosphate isomerase